LLEVFGFQLGARLRRVHDSSESFGWIFAGVERAAEKGLDLDEEHEKHTSGAKALGRFAGFMYGLKPVPFNASSFSAACKARGCFVAFAARKNPPLARSSIAE
jgi:hypothetical protein